MTSSYVGAIGGPPPADPARWRQLVLFSMAHVPVQAMWLAYAPVIHEATAYYGVSELDVGLLVLAFQAVFLVTVLPLLRLVRDRGGRLTLFAAMCCGAIGGLARAVVGPNYPAALVATLFLAVTEPVLLILWTQFVATWFPRDQRATASSAVMFAILGGLACGTFLTPWLTVRYGLQAPQYLYAVVLGVMAVVYRRFAREGPQVPQPIRDAVGMTEGLHRLLRSGPFRFLLVFAWLVAGIFNSAVTWLDAYGHDNGLQELGGFGLLSSSFLLGAGLGVLTLPPISDMLQRRVAVFVFGGGIAGLSAALLAALADVGAVWLPFAAFAYGYGLGALLPLGIQYGAEIGRPAPELVSGALLLFVVQASVVISLVFDLWVALGGTRQQGLFAFAAIEIVGTIVAARYLPEPTEVVGIGPSAVVPPAPLPQTRDGGRSRDHMGRDHTGRDHTGRDR